jgi:hypothetical protein
MKKASFLSAATLFLFFGFQVSMCAQKSATWKGGTPGRGTDWTCAGNWKEGRVPNEFSDVLIPDMSSTTGFLPVIRTEVTSVNSLTILSGGHLRIEMAGRLEVFGAVETFGSGSIQNAGSLQAPLYGRDLTQDHPMAVFTFN